MTPTVQYRDVSGLPGYRVGDDGSVWSCWQRVFRPSGFGYTAAMSDTWRRLIGSRDQYGRAIFLAGRHSGDGKRRVKRINRLILETFVGPCPPGMECCHNDGSLANNALVNLRWDTPQANQADKLKHGTHSRGKPLVRLTNQEVLDIRSDRSAGLSVGAIARKRGRSIRAISRVFRQGEARQ